MDPKRKKTKDALHACTSQPCKLVFILLRKLISNMMCFQGNERGQTIKSRGEKGTGWMVGPKLPNAHALNPWELSTVPEKGGPRFTAQTATSSLPMRSKPW